MLLLSISPSFVHSFINSVKNISLIQVMYKRNSNFIGIDFLKKYNGDNCCTNQIFSDMRTFTHTTPEEHTTIFLATTLHTTQLSKKPFCISYKYYLFTKPSDSLLQNLKNMMKKLKKLATLASGANHLFNDGNLSPFIEDKGSTIFVDQEMYVLCAS